MWSYQGCVVHSKGPDYTDFIESHPYKSDFKLTTSWVFYPAKDLDRCGKTHHRPLVTFHARNVWTGRAHGFNLLKRMWRRCCPTLTRFIDKRNSSTIDIDKDMDNNIDDRFYIDLEFLIIEIEIVSALMLLYGLDISLIWNFIF